MTLVIHAPAGCRISTELVSLAAQVLRTSTVGNTFSNLGRQLLDGHWVLSFIDADRCAAARDLVDAGQVVAPGPQFPPTTPGPETPHYLASVRSCRRVYAQSSRVLTAWPSCKAEAAAASVVMLDELT